jgi:hypothetical protein
MQVWIPEKLNVNIGNNFKFMHTFSPILILVRRLSFFSYYPIRVREVRDQWTEVL